MGVLATIPVTIGPEVQRFCWKFRIGDRLIQTENNYNRDVFNGDLGVIEKINRIEQVLAFSKPRSPANLPDGRHGLVNSIRRDKAILPT